MKLPLYYLSIVRDSVLDVLFPQICIGCQKRGFILCDLCISKIDFARRETSDDIRALYDYRDPVIRRVIWNLKYYRRRYLGQILGNLLYENYLEDMSEMQIFAGGLPIIIIPVPISHNRKKKRGYNQAEIIARHFSVAINKSANRKIFHLDNHVIVKNKETASQATITNRTRRLKNMKDAFEIKNKGNISGRTFIVIDDVTTTGATLNEIIKLLNNGGAKKVIGMALAH